MMKAEDVVQILIEAGNTAEAESQRADAARYREAAMVVTAMHFAILEAADTFADLKKEVCGES